MDKSNKAEELIIANKELVAQNEEKEKRAAELIIANLELAFQNEEKEKRAAELIIANKELAFQNKEKEKRAAELIIANKELAFQKELKGKRAATLVIADKELAFQNEEKGKRAAELIIADKELVFQNEEKEKRAAELIIANKELVFQNDEKEKRAAELIIANKELAFQNEEKEKRAAELIIANKELVVQNEEKEKRAAELIIANKELAFQNEEKEKRAAELIIANKELAFQNQEKEKRAAEKGKRAEELIIANKELAFQNKEKEKRAAELGIANIELVFQNDEKEKRAAELIVANKELVFQNDEKEKRAAELTIANKELAFQNNEKEKRAAELIIANKELAFQNEEKEKRAAELIIANRELKKAEEQFRLVVESAPNALALVNPEGFITLVNNQTEQLFGYERNELIGNKIEILIPKQFNSQHPALRQAYFEKPVTRSMGAGRDLFAKRKNGTEFQVEIGLNPIETAEGLMVLASINDITERKLQEATLKRQLELEIKNKELEQFAYIASHDLQEPLRTVSNYMQVFEEDYLHLLDENAHNYIQSVNSATKRMSMLIKSLLDFSRLGHNTKLTNVDFNKLIAEVIADLDTVIKTSNATIEVTAMPTLNVYESEIRQVFQNLITNAIKFQKKDVQPKIKISSEQLNGKWKFSVRDNGIGIDPIHFERVFDIFQRLHANEDYEGNGIGLANCKKIVQLHHGEIDIESGLGKGTTFNFTIQNLTA